MRKYFVHPAITTRCDCGIPGETEEEFEQTKAYLEHIHFMRCISLSTQSEKAPAAVMPDQIDEQIKAARKRKAHSTRS